MESSKLFKSLCECASSSNVSQIAKLLEHEMMPSLSCRETLLPPSACAIELLQQIFDNNASESPNLDVPMIIRACLISPSAYELPWKVALKCIQALQKNATWTTEQAASIITDVQIFFQQSVSQWHDYNRSITNGTKKAKPLRRTSGPEPVDCLLEWIDAILDPIQRQADSNNYMTLMHNNRIGILIRDLVSSVVIVARDLDQDFQYQALERLFDNHVQVHPSQIIMWFCIALELKDYLRVRDFHFILLQTRLVIPETSTNDWPELAKAILTMGITHTAEQCNPLSGIKLLIYLLDHTSADLVAYSKVESILFETMLAFSQPMLQKFAACLAKISPIPKYIHLNLWLLVWRCHHDSGAHRVAKVLARVLGSKKNEEANIVASVVDALIKMLQVHDHTLQLKGCSYVGRGRFETEQGTHREMTMAGEAVFQSLFLRTSIDTSSHQEHVLVRARTLIQLAERALIREDTHQEAAVIFVTVFREIPLARSQLVQILVQELGDNRSDLKRSLFYCDILSVITTNLDHHDPELESIASLLSNHLPKELFLHLSSALLSVQNAQDALLGFVRAFLAEGSYLTWSSLDLDGTVECCIHTLFLLTLRDTFSIEAWRMLSVLIVSGKPCIPVKQRSFVFKWLGRKVKELSSDACERLLRICLLRAFFLIYHDYSGVERVVVGAQNGPLYDEDLPGLFHLVLFLNEGREYKTIGAKNLVAACFHDIMHVVIEGESSENVDKRPGILPSSDADCLTKAWVYVVSSIFNEVRSKPFQVRLSCYSRKDLLQSVLIREEMHLFQKFHGDEPDYISHVASILILEENDDGLPLFPEDISSDSGNDSNLQCQLLDAAVGWAAIFSSSNNLSIISGSISAFFYQRRILTHNKLHGEIIKLSLESFVAVGQILVDETKSQLYELMKRSDFFKLDRYLTSVKDFCVEFSNFIGNEGTLTETECNSALTLSHQFYEVMGSEASVARFLTQLLRNSKWRGHIFLQESASNTETVCTVVRSIRTSVLRLSVASLTASEVSFRAHNSWNKNYDNKCIFVAKWMKQLSQDCSLGLDSRSGALTEDMLMLFTDGAAACARLLAIYDISLESSLILVHTMMQQTTESFFDIICTYDLPHSSSFKKTCNLVFATMPRLGMEITHRWLMSHSNLPEKYEKTWLTKYLDKSSLQCVAIVWNSKMSTKDKTVVSWESCIDSRHQSDYNKDDQYQCESTVAKSSAEKYLQLRTHRTWTWAVLAIVEAVETHCTDSATLLETNENVFLDESWDLLARFRLYFVRQLFLQMTRFFAYTTGQEGPGGVIAYLLPKVVKTRLCSLLDCWLSTLSKAVNKLGCVLREQMSMTSPAFIEAIAVLGSWLLSPQSENNILVKIRQWNIYEREALESQRDESYVVEPVYVRKLPKLVYKADAMEQSLHQLISILKSKEEILDSHVAFAHFISEEIPSPLWKALELRIDDLKKQRLVLEDPLESSERCRKRNLGQYAAKRIQKQRKREVLRSRNKTIDKWMHEDRAFDDADDDDAYADLEEFLVEG